MATPHLRLSAEDRRQQIIEQATELFARQGFEGTTTRQIASQAGVNEAIMFRHFPSKEELYWAVIEHKCSSTGGRVHLKEVLKELLDSSRSEREVLETIAEDYLRRRAEDPTITRLLLFSALENHQLSGRFFRTHIAEYYEMLAEYIRERMQQGQFRNTDPLLAARSFLGMVVYHFLLQDLFGGNQYHRYDPKEVSRTVAGIWLDGMLRKPRPGVNHKGQRVSRQGEKGTPRAKRTREGTK